MHSRRIQKKVKKDYNEIAGEFAGTRQFPWKDFELFEEYYRSDFDVLDLGCGNGRLLQFLEKHGFKSYLGVDQSEKLLEIARNEHPKQRFLLADMSDLPDLGRKFDAIFAIASFHHLSPRWQLKTLREWRKLLKPGGYIFMTNWNLHQPKYWWLLVRSLIFPVYGVRGLLVPWRHTVNRYYFAFTKMRLARLLEKAGFVIVKNDYVKEGKTAKLLDARNILTIARNENS